MAPGRSKADIEADTRRLIEHHKIRFKDWQPCPEPYSKLVNVVNTINLEDYTTYRPDDFRDESTVFQMRRRIHDVVNAAKLTYTARANEETLRMWIERPVLERFYSESECHRCCLPLWKADYSAESALQDQEGPSRSAYARPLMCRCTMSDRFGSTSFQHNTRLSPITIRNSVEVEHHADDEVPSIKHPVRKPDTVVGLNVTVSIERYIKEMPYLKHTPFSKDNGIVYPFFVSEAKPGDQNSGFRSIDEQTALPIHTSLMLQKRLCEASKVEILPLVWYMAYKGNLCALSVAILQEDEIHIHTLWEGSLKCPKKVLQLLLIIDYIADWARTVFKKAVLACLARGQDFVQRQTPAPSSQSTSSQTRVLCTSPAPGIAHEEEDLSALNEAVMNELVMDTDSDDTGDSDAASSEGSHSSQASPKRNDGTDVFDQSKLAVSRSACTVKYEFEHVRLPDTEADLLKVCNAFSFVNNTSTGDQTKTHASRLASFFAARSTAMPLSEYRILCLRNEWLRLEADIRCRNSEESQFTWTWIRLESGFDVEGWHIVRRLVLFSCSNTAIAGLVRIAGLDRQLLMPVVRRIDSMFDQVKDAIGLVRCLSGSISVQAALRCLSHDLQREPGIAGIQWHLGTLNLEALSTDLFAAIHRVDYESPEKLTDKSTVLLPILPAYDRPEITRLFTCGAQPLSSQILLQKPQRWPQETAKWCLMRLDEERDCVHEPTFKDGLKIAIRERQVFVAEKTRHLPDLTPHHLDPADEQLLFIWAGQSPQMTHIIAQRPEKRRRVFDEDTRESIIWLPD